MHITGVQIGYYFHCKRQLWLFAHSIQMEQENENVKIGKLISETSYKRKKHEIEVHPPTLPTSRDFENSTFEGGLQTGDVKIDFFDKQTNTIHEIKKTNSFEQAHIWQVLYYIYVLKKNGIENVKGEIDYPKMKKRVDVILTPEKEKELESILVQVRNIIESDMPMTVSEANVKKAVCRKCSYYELCYS